MAHCVFANVPKQGPEAGESVALGSRPFEQHVREHSCPPLRARYLGDAEVPTHHRMGHLRRQQCHQRRGLAARLESLALLCEREVWDGLPRLAVVLVQFGDGLVRVCGQREEK